MSCVKETNEACMKWSDSQEDYCIRCNDGYYYLREENQCVECPTECVTCFNTTMCLSCKDGYSIDFNYKCIDSNSVVPGCKQLVYGTTRCALCYDYYFRNNEGACDNCIDRCETCFDSHTCIECEKNYFLKSDSTECISYDALVNCTEKLHSGCGKCIDGYFVQDQYCVKCEEKTENCELCQNNGNCKSCRQEYVLSLHECVHYTSIKGCLSAENSKCAACGFWYSPSEDGLSCEEAPVWWVILLGVIGVLIILIVVIILMSLIIKKIVENQKLKEDLKQYELFSLKKTDMTFIPTPNPDIQLSMTEIHFSLSDENEKDNLQIPVDAETKKVLYVANVSNNKVKVQFSMKEGIYKY